MSVTVVNHPILQAQLSSLRDKNTSPADFRRLVKGISTILAIEASRTLPVAAVEGLETPVSSYVGTKIAQRVGLSPILRAGIGMVDALLELHPAAQVHYLGLFREKVSLQPIEYYQKLPPTPTVDVLYILDPLVATGGTAIASVSMLLDWGLQISQIKLLALLGSKPGLEAVAAEYPGLEIFIGAVDETLTENGMIFPGLGDSGDRLFSTA